MAGRNCSKSDGSIKSILELSRQFLYTFHFEKLKEINKVYSEPLKVFSLLTLSWKGFLSLCQLFVCWSCLLVDWFCGLSWRIEQTGPSCWWHRVRWLRLLILRNSAWALWSQIYWKCSVLIGKFWWRTASVSELWVRAEWQSNLFPFWVGSA